MLIIIFAYARLALIPANPEAAAEILAPFAPFNGAEVNGSEGDAESYAVACQAIEGQEFSLSELIEIGVLDEDGDPAEGIVVLRAA